MDMVAQIAHRLQTILNEEAETLGKETTFLKRKRKITAPDFVQQLIFAWWQEPTITNDLGFFSLERFRILSRPSESRKKRRSFLTRWQPGTVLLTRSGHRISLKGIVPQAVGGRLQMRVLVGAREKIPMRLLIERVSAQVAAQREQRMRETAAAHGREATQEMLEMAHWSIILTNALTRLLSFDEALILLRLRWQIERLFRLWKEHGFIDEWGSKKSWRILTEIYAKLSAMVIQQWLITAGTWHDPERSLFKAAQALRREANRIMVALDEGGLDPTLRSIVRTLALGCQLNRRQQEPSTAQLLQGWPEIWPQEKTRPKPKATEIAINRVSYSVRGPAICPEPGRVPNRGRNPYFQLSLH